MEERVIIVNQSNEQVGLVPRSVMRRDVLLHRSSYVIVINAKNELLIQKRSSTKDVFPGYFDPTSGGVVQAEETYEDNALRELREEVGIEGVSLNFLCDFHYEGDQCKVWGRAFWVKYDGDIQLVDGEVESFEMISIERIWDFLAGKNVMQDGLIVLRNFLERY